MARRKAGGKSKVTKPKALAGEFRDSILPMSVAHGKGRTLQGTPIPAELTPFLLPDKRPWSRCAHCGTTHAAMLNAHSPSCPCLCHAARRYDQKRWKEEVTG
jgi:hypothetical protein